MYEAFFGLRSRPFSPLPRVDTFIPLAPLREPQDSLVRCIAQEQGIGVLTAPQGAGKSLVCRLLQHHFRELRRTVLLTTARFPTRRSLLQAILFELKHPYIGLSEQEARLRVLDLLQASPAPLNRMLLIVDEAHLLSPRGLEELRTLTDYETDGTPCVSLILSGQLELEELLTEPTMNALNQRVGCHVCIEPLTFEESAQYIRERLRLAGNDGLTLFTPEAIQLVCSASEGNPRRLNQLCDHSLLLAFAEEERPIDVLTVRAALLDLRELPLHWNAPLDLAEVSDRNPLEAFVESHEAEMEVLQEEPFAECETEIDEEEDSAFEMDSNDNIRGEGASVFEVGSTLEQSPFEQLFQVTKFVVPGNSRDADETTPPTPHAELSQPLESHAFETAPPEAQTEDATMFETELPGRGFEFGGELVLADSPHTLANSATRRQPAFEESAVDDVYALIDRLREASNQTVIRRTPRNVVPLSIEEISVNQATDGRVKVDESFEDIDDTLFDDVLAQSKGEIPVSFDPPAHELDLVLQERQLLDFINEISLDVRQFRDELHTHHVEPGEETTGSTITDDENAQLPRVQSLRQTLNWQFDVVEPELGQSEMESLQAVCEPPTPSLSPEASQQASPVDTPVANAESLIENRRYAQLFTRLQRQRRRVEAVMNRERRNGVEVR